jgi:hypothetical protein
MLTPFSIASFTTRSGSISPATACDAHASTKHQKRRYQHSGPLYSPPNRPQAARSLRRYLRARSLAACCAQARGSSPRIDHPTTGCHKLSASEAPDPGDIRSEYRATSSRNARATSSESARTCRSGCAMNPNTVAIGHVCGQKLMKKGSWFIERHFDSPRARNQNQNCAE